MAPSLENMNKVYDELVQRQNQLNIQTKSITEKDKLKEIEQELTFIGDLLRRLLKVINLYKNRKDP